MKSSLIGHSQNIHPAKICVHTVCIACVVLYVYIYIIPGVLVQTVMTCYSDEHVIWQYGIVQ